MPAAPAPHTLPYPTPPCSRVCRRAFAAPPSPAPPPCLPGFAHLPFHRFARTHHAPQHSVLVYGYIASATRSIPISTLAGSAVPSLWVHLPQVETAGDFCTRTSLLQLPPPSDQRHGGRRHLVHILEPLSCARASKRDTAGHLIDALHLLPLPRFFIREPNAQGTRGRQTTSMVNTTVDVHIPFTYYKRYLTHIQDIPAAYGHISHTPPTPSSVVPSR